MSSVEKYPSIEMHDCEYVPLGVDKIRTIKTVYQGTCTRCRAKFIAKFTKFDPTLEPQAKRLIPNYRPTTRDELLGGDGTGGCEDEAPAYMSSSVQLPNIEEAGNLVARQLQATRRSPYVMFARETAVVDTMHLPCGPIEGASFDRPQYGLLFTFPFVYYLHPKINTLMDWITAAGEGRRLYEMVEHHVRPQTAHVRRSVDSALLQLPGVAHPSALPRPPEGHAPAGAAEPTEEFLGDGGEVVRRSPGLLLHQPRQGNLSSQQQQQPASCSASWQSPALGGASSSSPPGPAAAARALLAEGRRQRAKLRDAAIRSMQLSDYQKAAVRCYLNSQDPEFVRRLFWKLTWMSLTFASTGVKHNDASVCNILLTTPDVLRAVDGRSFCPAAQGGGGGDGEWPRFSIESQECFQYVPKCRFWIQQDCVPMLFDMGCCESENMPNPQTYQQHNSKYQMAMDFPTYDWHLPVNSLVSMLKHEGIDWSRLTPELSAFLDYALPAEVRGRGVSHREDPNTRQAREAVLFDYRLVRPGNCTAVLPDLPTLPYHDYFRPLRVPDSDAGRTKPKYVYVPEIKTFRAAAALA